MKRGSPQGINATRYQNDGRKRALFIEAVPGSRDDVWLQIRGTRGGYCGRVMVNKADLIAAVQAIK